MSIQFNRESIQGLWERKSGRAGATGPLPALEQALADNQLTRQEYTDLKQAFLKENPGGNFEAFLADALDGKCDQQISPQLQQAIAHLRDTDQPLSLAFHLNTARDGFSNVAALTFEKPAAELFSFVEQADSDRNGRIEQQERQQLRQALSRNGNTAAALRLLEAQLQDAHATLRYESGGRITVLLGGTIPAADKRYQDVRLDMDLHLKDSNGITDNGQNDLSGVAGGQLDFDWNGPLVTSLKRALSDSSSGWVQANARYVPAGDPDGYGPGYVIQAETPRAQLPLVGEVGLATRPLVLRHDEQGRLFVASPGFGETARLWAAEKALNSYGLPELAKMGIAMRVQRENGRLYLTPGALHIGGLSLAAQGQGGQSELRLGLTGSNTRFSVGPEGLQARFQEVAVQGSSDLNLPTAKPDASPDTLQAKVQVGLNTDLTGKLETQVIVKDATARVQLDKGEIAALQALPGQARALLGEHSSGQLQFRGEYRSSGSDYQAALSGKFTLGNTAANGDQSSVFSHFQTASKSGDSGLSFATAGTELSVSHQGQVASTTAGTGNLSYASGEPIRVQLFNTRGEAQINTQTLTTFQKILRQGGPRAQQLTATLQASGLSAQTLERLTHGDSTHLKALLNSQAFTDQLKNVSLRLQAQNWQFELGEERYRVAGTAVQLKAQGNAAGSEATDTTLEAELSSSEVHLQGRHQGDFQLAARQTTFQADTTRQTSLGAFSAGLKARAADLRLAQTTSEQPPQLELQQAHAELDATARMTTGGSLKVQAHLQSGQGKTSAPLEADAVQASVHYRSAAGTEASLNAELKQARFSLRPDGSVSVQAPNARLTTHLQTSLQELRQALGQLGAEKLAHLLETHDPADVQRQLQATGLSQEQARTAAQLFWRPELRELFKTSTFVQGLKQSEQMQLKASVAGVLAAEAGQAELTQATLKTDFQVATASGQPLIQGQAEVQQANLSQQGSHTHLTATRAQAELNALRPDGSKLARLSGQAENLRGQLQKQGYALSSDALQSELTAQTRLEPAKVAQIRKILADFRDHVQEKLQTLGLSRQQFEQFIRAVGKEQLSQLFRSAKPEQLAHLSRELGVSPEQIERLTGLLNDQGFARLVDHAYAFSQMLEQGEGRLQLSASAQSGRWHKQDQDMLASLQTLELRGTAQASSESGRMSATVQGRSHQVQFKQNEQQTAVTWGDYTARAEGQAVQQGKTLHAEAQTSGHSGSITQQGQTVQSHFGAAQGQLSAPLDDREGSQAMVSAEGGFTAIESRRHLTEQNQSELKITGLHQNAAVHIADQAAGQVTRAELRAHTDTIVSSPEQVRLGQGQFEARISSEQQTKSAAGRVSGAQAEVAARVTLNQLASGGGEVQLEQASVSGEARSRLSQAGKTESEMGLRVEKGQVKAVRAREGHVTVQQLAGQLKASARTPIQTSEAEGHLSMTELEARDSQLKAQTFNLDRVNGQLQVRSDKLGEILSNSPDARRILSTVYERWGKEGAPNLFKNESITLHVSQASLQGRRDTGNALTATKDIKGSFTLPDLQTQLGDARVQIDLNRLSLSPQPDQATEVEVGGRVAFQPRQPQFNQSVQRLVAAQLKQLGLNAEVQAELKNGRIDVKIDDFLADGLISVGFDQEQIEVSVDRAKLLGFISARGLASRLVESQLNNYLFEVERQDTRLSLSLSEVTRQTLHRDNLQIQKLSVSPTNGIDVRFTYTDTPAYNASARQRSQQRLEQMLFRDPVKRQSRNADQLESVVEDLAAPAVRRIFREASPAQLNQIFAAVGKDRDWLVRERALAGLKKTDYDQFPAENRAVMAYQLTDRSGLFNTVGQQERQLVIDLFRSLKRSDADVFLRQLSAEQLTRILHELRDHGQGFALKAFTEELKQKLGAGERLKLRRALEALR